MCRLQNILADYHQEKHDYQKCDCHKISDGQTYARQSDSFVQLCFADNTIISNTKVKLFFFLLRQFFEKKKKNLWRN